MLFYLISKKEVNTINLDIKHLTIWVVLAIHLDLTLVVLILVIYLMIYWILTEDMELLVLFFISV